MYVCMYVCMYVYTVYACYIISHYYLKVNFNCDWILIEILIAVTSGGQQGIALSAYIRLKLLHGTWDWQWRAFSNNINKEDNVHET